MRNVILSVAKNRCGRAAPFWRLLRAARAHRSLPFAVLRVGMTLVAACATTSRSPMLDLKNINARIIDGTGAPWYRGTVGVRGDTIVAIGDIPDMPAKTTIDARGNIVAPGFIDLLGQSQTAMFDDPHL